MFDFIKKTILFGSGLATLTAEKIEEAIDEFVKKGELSEKEGKELVLELVQRSKKAGRELGDKIEKIVSDTLHRLNIPSRKELEELEARIELLEKTGDKKE